MTTADPIERRALDLLDAARTFQSAAEQPGSYVAAPATLGSLEETLQVLSAAWYQLAADAVPRVDGRSRRAIEQTRPASSDGLSREADVQLVGTLHDVAAAFARCARVCRDGRSVATPIIGPRVAAGRAHALRANGFPRFQRHERPRQRVS
jgi:hypothetical protein